MSGPDLLERTRMALAEVGCPPQAALEIGPTGNVTFDTWLVLPIDAWRAASIARSPEAKQVCWRCLEPVGFRGMSVVSVARAACLADRPLVRDCGVAR